MTLEKLKEYSPVLARYAIAIVFLLIGVDQLINQEFWISYFPTTLFNIPLEKIVLYNGIFDTLIGALLLIGLLTRIISIIASLHLIVVIYYLGYNDISIRDIGLLILSISVFFQGPDKLCLDKKIFKPKTQINMDSSQA